MKNTAWKDIAELIGITAIVASLIFLTLEVRQSRQVGQAEVAAIIIDTSNQVRALLLANSDVWTRGCSGDELSATERAVYAQVFRAYIQNLYWSWVLGNDSIIEWDEMVGVNMYAANYHRYRGFASMSNSQLEWLRNIDVNAPERAIAFGEAIGNRIVQLREIEPNPEYDPALCRL